MVVHKDNSNINQDKLKNTLLSRNFYQKNKNQIQDKKFYAAVLRRATSKTNFLCRKRNTNIEKLLSKSNSSRRKQNLPNILILEKKQAEVESKKFETTLRWAEANKNNSKFIATQRQM